MVSNKIDLRGNGPKDVEDIITEATTWAREHDLPVIYTSAKTPTNVSDAFQLALALSIETRTALRHVVSIVLLVSRIIIDYPDICRSTIGTSMIKSLK